jgi:adenine-specific DNA-methyltransferase
MAAVWETIAMRKTSTSANRADASADRAESGVLSHVALREELRATAQGSVEKTKLALAEEVTLAAVRAYWRAINSDLALPELPHEICAPKDSFLCAADRFGCVVATLPVPDAAYQLGLLYTGLLPLEWRATKGIHYTPPALANRLLDQAEAAGLDWKRAQILDPAAGAGAFLVPAAERMLRALGPCTPAVAMQNLAARLHGFELDSFAAWLGQVFIEAAAVSIIGETRRRMEPIITICDSLALEPGRERFDLVIGNPPFGRVTLPEKQRARFARSLYGHANLYGLFMDLAIQLAKPEGLVSFLTPSSFLAGEYFKNLRALLAEDAPPLTLDFVHLRKGVFEDVLQETVLATYQKGARRSRASVFFLDPQPGQRATPEPAGTFTLPRQANAPWLLPRHADGATLAKRLRSMPERLADWGYKVSTGPLVWNRFKPQLCDKPGKNTIPLVWAESVTSDGRFIFRSDRRNHKPYFRLQEGDDWLVVRSSCVLVQRTTAKEQARRLIAAEMPTSFMNEHGGVTVENHLNMLVPIVPKPSISPTLLAAFLNSAAADRAFRCLSGSVAVSAYELESLPLPTAGKLKSLLGRKTDSDAVEKAWTSLYADDGDL